MNDDLIIKVEHVSKQYRLGAIGGTTLREDLQRLSAKIRHKEDPTVKIGQETDEKHIGEVFYALNDVSFEIKKGEAVGIIGGNGAGKSTLLKLLSRVTAPTEGQISYNGRITSMLEVGTGFHPELTGRENIYMNGAILGMTKSEIKEKIEEIIDFSEVREFIDTPVKRYSSGMYVKLAFSVASHLDSEIMIMDEVLAVGDMAFQKKCLDKMRDAANNEGKTILYVSHNMNTIRQLCDRCIVLDKGHKVFDGAVEDAISVYLSSKVNIINEKDPCSQKRVGYDIDELIHLDNVSAVRNQYHIYNPNENILIDIEYSAKKEINNMCMRMTLLSKNHDVVGLATTNNEIKTRKGKNTIRLNFNFDCLAPGKYYMRLTAYSINGYGRKEEHDVVDDAFYFEKLESFDTNNTLAWNHSWWGYLMLPKISVETEN